MAFNGDEFSFCGLLHCNGAIVYPTFAFTPSYASTFANIAGLAISAISMLLLSVGFFFMFGVVLFPYFYIVGS